MPPPCEWCGSRLPARRMLFRMNGRPVALHLQICLARWVETERALGRSVPGEPRWRPSEEGTR